ncbi:MAG: hypothetical protein DMF63_14935 [Acidobacteria bacterium]|nr:MAG: hypothetical protein DMF63_14935 [Acidobacteriota bacterium]
MASAASKFSTLRSLSAFSALYAVESESFDIAEAAMLQAGTPAFQSHPPSATNYKLQTTNYELRTTNYELNRITRARNLKLETRN